MKKTILVTGANGQLGNELRRQVAGQVSVSDACDYLFTDVAELDICDERAVRDFVATHAVDAIVNCAAFTAVDRAEDEPELCARLNHDAVAHLARAAEENKAELVQISTDYVFDGTSHRPYRESDRPCPVSVYGRTKLAGEEAALNLCSRAMVIRTAWLYSPFGNNFVKTMLRLGREREAIGVVVDQIGSPTSARDLAAAILSTLRQGVRPGVYHFTDEGVCSWYDFTKAIHRLGGITACRVSPLHTGEYPSKAPRPAYSVLDKQKIRDVYGLDIPYWMDSLETCVHEICKNGQ